MTDEELVSLLLVHPRLRVLIRSIANAEARSMVEHYLAVPGDKLRWITYREAERRLKLKRQTVRVYVSTGKLTGGNGRVTEASVEALLAKRKVNSHG